MQVGLDRGPDLLIWGSSAWRYARAVPTPHPSDAHSHASIPSHRTAGSPPRLTTNFASHALHRDGGLSMAYWLAWRWSTKV